MRDDVIRNKCPNLYIVVPCYNEEEVIEKTIKVLLDKIDNLIKDCVISNNSKIVFVNDGSVDKTRKIICDYSKIDSRICLVNFACNYGHQSAILAGMNISKKADVVITIDADLQQDVNAIDSFLKCYENGAEVVYGVRNDRETDGFLKKITALTYYKLMDLLGGNIIKNHADYRLMSRKVLDVLLEYNETNLFLRGLIPSLGFESDIVYFDVKEREYGKSKYTVGKMINLAINGITSFTIRPLHIIAGMGGFITFSAFIIAIVCIVEWFQGKNVLGYTTILIVMMGMFGIVLISLGVLGEYIGKIYLETKRRPRYVIDSVILKGDDYE